MADCHPDREHKAKGLCSGCYAEQWHRDNPELKRRQNLKSRYDIEPEEYDFLLAIQGGTCAICRKLPDDEQLCVDHDHATRAIRGLLCRRCNSGIAVFGDSAKGVERALKYLERAS